MEVDSQRGHDPDKTIIIVGAGISGLTCGLSFLQQGWPCVVVLESDESFSFRLQGFHYHLNEDHYLDQCLLKLGILDDVYALKIDNDGYEMALSDASNRALLTWDGRNDSAIGDISRGAIRSLLMANFRESGGIVQFGAKVTAVSESAAHACVYLRSGCSLRGRLLVGADGIYSVVRKSTIGECLRVDPFTINARGRCKNSGQLQGILRHQLVRFLIVCHRSGSSFFISFYNGEIIWLAVLRRWTQSCCSTHAWRYYHPSLAEVTHHLQSERGWHPCVLTLVSDSIDFYAEYEATVDVSSCRERLISEPAGRIILISDALHALGGGGGAWAFKDGCEVASETLGGVQDPMYGIGDLSSNLQALHAFQLANLDKAIGIDVRQRRFWGWARWFAFLFNILVTWLPFWMLKRPLGIALRYCSGIDLRVH